MRLRHQKGFTLLELLVVISIIAILVAVGAASYSTAQRKGRDSKRRGDMKAIQAAFEQYYAKESSYDSANCANMAADGIMPGYPPRDPKNDWPPNNPGYAITCTPFTNSTSNIDYDYCACARLENEVGNSSDDTCAYSSDSDNTYFCVSNLQ